MLLLHPFICLNTQQTNQNKHMANTVKMASRTFDPNLIPKSDRGAAMDATRVSAHRENQENNLAPVNNSGKMRDIGKEGIKGDGQTR